jgi:EAL domain-containing protein (putative c-di-GMP-specific phosphodiesterase class I)
MLMQNTDAVIQILTELKDEGIRISMDDFGTGYSSFSYLKKLPIDDLKIDKSFIRDIEKDEESRAIVQSIIHLAKTLKLNTIAEGVETVEQVEFLRLHGCDCMQGYYFSKPVSSRDFMEMVLGGKRLE